MTSKLVSPIAENVELNENQVEAKQSKLDTLVIALILVCAGKVGIIVVQATVNVDGGSEEDFKVLNTYLVPALIIIF